MSDTVKGNKMGTMPVGKLLASMSIPMMISMLAQAFYNIVDSVFVASLNENALTAVSLAFPLQSLMIAFSVGTGVGMSTLVSRALGAKDHESCERGANTGIFLFILTAIVFALIGVFFSEPFFRAQTDVEEIIGYGKDYALVCLGCSIGLFGQVCFERLLQATGRTSFSMWTQLIGAVINIVMDPILIFNKGDSLFNGLIVMPFGAGWGVAGAAVATVMGQIISAAVGVIFNLKYNHEIKIHPKLIRWHTPTIKGIYRIGFPSIVMQSISSVMTFSLNRILIDFTTTATAVLGSYFKLQSFIFMPVFGLNNGMVPIISYNYGARDKKRLKKAVRLTILSAMCIMAVGTIAFELVPDMLLGIFSPSDNMLAIGVPALRIIGTHFVVAGFCIIGGSVCQAVGNPFYSLIISVCRQLVVLLPAAYLLSLTGKLELVWLAFPIAEVMSLIMTVIFFIRTMRKIDKELP